MSHLIGGEWGCVPGGEWAETRGVSPEARGCVPRGKGVCPWRRVGVTRKSKGLVCFAWVHRSCQTIDLWKGCSDALPTELLAEMLYVWDEQSI